MSIKEDLAAAGREWNGVKQRMSIAGTVLATSMIVATVLKDGEATVWKIVAIKRLIRLTRAYTAGILFAADQLNAELAVINGKKGQDEDQKK